MHAKLFTRHGAIRADGLPQGGGAELNGRHKKSRLGQGRGGYSINGWKGKIDQSA